MAKLLERVTGTSITVTYFSDDNSLIIGSAECSVIYTLNQMYFNRLYVRPEHRRKGFGTKLLTRLLEIIKEKDLELQLDINPYGDMDYAQLESFYMKHGFEKSIISDTELGEFYTYFYNKKEE